jgi:hypothetical protein
VDGPVDCAYAPPGEYMKDHRHSHDHTVDFTGHRETQGIAFSRDLTEWVNLSDRTLGSGVLGRDSHVVRVEERAMGDALTARAPLRHLQDGLRGARLGVGYGHVQAARVVLAAAEAGIVPFYGMSHGGHDNRGRRGVR